MSQATPAALVAENLLLGHSTSTCPNQVWVDDSTYLPLVRKHWCYLVTWRDTYSRRVVDWYLTTQISRVDLHPLRASLGVTPSCPQSEYPH
ncbi:MAG: DDE-type integrase/transposase/recombinase [Janthinobacterium lividum]